MTHVETLDLAHLPEHLIVLGGGDKLDASAATAANAWPKPCGSARCCR